MKKWTGERLETFVQSRDTIDHLHRYAIVLNYIKNKIVLDIASGEGYGSNIMSHVASFVYGVDIDNTIIKEAKLKYKKENLEFITGSASQIPLEDRSVDVVVSFETIEHHDKHDEMMAEIKRVLKPKGLLIISTPDKLYYSDERNFNNEFHIKELYKQEFTDLISKNFSEIQLLTQKYSNGNSLIQDEREHNDLQVFSGNYKEIMDIIISPLYLIAIASEDVFEKQKLTVFDGSQIINTHFNNQMNEFNSKVYSSNSYKLGHLVLLPFKILKKIFK
ncbi:class I SAM-dependent methyltransferase [Flavobacterium sp. ZS1P14]|uniref:class I SAM-dependent methyltransferase n=1 Tax=Flavobacterium sp. ZS1P14 TaxID=3401729 RepID=UPI003AB0444C